MDFSQVKAITIPEGNVLRILSGATVLWERTGLPAEYQEVEYLESTGTQYIDTGIKGTENTKVDIAFQVTGDNFLPFGARRGATTGAFAIWSSNGNVGSALRIGFDGTAGYTGPATTRYKYHIVFGKEGAFVNDTKVWTPSNYTSFETPGTLLVFGYRPTPTLMSPCGMKLFALKLWENNVLARDLVPCYRKIDNVAGMYDVVNGVFYTNAGTGEFNVGADVIVLPADYQRVEYIKSTSDGGQWIDTGVPGENSNLRIDVSYMWDVVPVGGSYQNIISAYINETSNCTRIIQYGAGNTYVDVNIRANRSPAYRGTRVAGTRYNDSLTRTYYDVNGERLVLTETVTGSSNNHNLHLFSSSNHSGYAKSLRLYNCKLYDGNTIVRDFIPCYRKIDNVAGLYDVINDAFYPNGGSGAFTVGADV